jgi:hypothetical protein
MSRDALLLLFGVLLFATACDQTKAEPILPEAAGAPMQIHGGIETLTAVSGEAAEQGGRPVKDPPLLPNPTIVRMSKPVPGSYDASTQTSDALIMQQQLEPAAAAPSTGPDSVIAAVDDVIPAAIPAPDDEIITSSTAPMGSVASGAEAVALLGEDISIIAQAYGKQPDELSRLLLTDESLKLDEGKRLLYQCARHSSGAVVDIAADAGHHHHHHHHHRHHRKLAQHNADGADPLPNSLPQSATGVPLLHSRPTATRKIYLDFDGHTTTGKATL